MKIYLAGRYERRLELVTIAYELKQFGHEVTSQWLSGDHDNSPEKDCAEIDLQNIDEADGILLVSENGVPTHSRGGRHFEFGYAYARGKTMMLLGEREGVFHHLPEIEVFAELKDVLFFLKDS